MQTMKCYGTDFGIKNILATYSELDTEAKRDLFLPILIYLKKKKDAKIFLDSGAFSVFNSGKTISLKDYIKFIKKYRWLFDVIASLDVIYKPYESYKNFIEMRKEIPDDRNILPVYHHPEPLNVLDIYAKDIDVDYIGVGTVTQTSSTTKTLVPVLDRITKRLPKGKVMHLFGLANHYLLVKYARYVESSDSTRWKATQIYGHMSLPHGKSFDITKYNNYNLRGDITRRWSILSVRAIQKTEELVTEIQNKMIKKEGMQSKFAYTN